MGKTTGFLEYNRELAAYRPVSDRIKDYNDVVTHLSNKNIMIQTARCMDCGIPYCHSLGCSLHNLIPEWNDAIYNNQWQEAYTRLEITNNFPEITGRICPAQCEASCTLSINDSPVTIRQIELAIIEHAFNNGWVIPNPPEFESRKRVAIIGSGPAGLAAAQQLRHMGHMVTVFEKSQKPGGLLRYGIPNFKLEKYILDRRLKILVEEGIEFVTDVIVGEDISARYLKKKFDSVLLCQGAGEPRDLDVPGRNEQRGIHFAMEFLGKMNKHLMGEISEEKTISAKGKTVVVLGGGDTGSDCVGTANRQGAKKVYQFEIMPKPEEWTAHWNPQWPDWPRILRTSSSHEEGCEQDWCVSTKEFIGKNNTLRSLKCCHVKWEKQDRSTGPIPVEIKNSDFTINADLVLLSLGFVHVEHSRLLNEFGIEYDGRGNIKARNYQTSMPNIFTAGDANTGPSLVVHAINHGRCAAEAVNAYLKK